MNTKAMTDEELRIKIAKLCGWSIHHGNQYCALPDPETSSPLWGMLFDPVTDLNAMHEAEKTLSEDQHDCFRDKLGSLINNGEYYHWSDGGGIREFVSATARQRAEAFLSTLEARHGADLSSPVVVCQDCGLAMDDHACPLSSAPNLRQALENEKAKTQMNELEIDRLRCALRDIANAESAIMGAGLWARELARAALCHVKQPNPARGIWRTNAGQHDGDEKS